MRRRADEAFKHCAWQACIDDLDGSDELDPHTSDPQLNEMRARVDWNLRNHDQDEMRRFQDFDGENAAH